MNPIETLFDGIKDRRVRGVVVFIAVFAIGLVVGKVVEKALEEKTLVAASNIQAEWINTVAATTPLALGSGYIGDMDAVQHGEWLYPAAPTTQEISAERSKAAKRRACENAKMVGSVGLLSCIDQAHGLQESDCLADPSRTGCAAFQACLTTARARPLLPAECAGVSDSPAPGAAGSFSDAPRPETHTKPPIILVPLIAIGHLVTRLFAGGALPAFFTCLQCGLGWLILLVVTSSQKGPGFGNVFGNLVIGPIAVIALGSVVAFLLKWLMLGALFLFHSVFAFAAIAAGASGVGTGCWYCVTKLIEKGAEHAVVG